MTFGHNWSRNLTLCGNSFFTQFRHISHFANFEIKTKIRGKFEKPKAWLWKQLMDKNLGKSRKPNKNRRKNEIFPLIILQNFYWHNFSRKTVKFWYFSKYENSSWLNFESFCFYLSILSIKKSENQKSERKGDSRLTSIEKKNLIDDTIKSGLSQWLLWLPESFCYFNLSVTNHGLAISWDNEWRTHFKTPR